MSHTVGSYEEKECVRTPKSTTSCVLHSNTWGSHITGLESYWNWGYTIWTRRFATRGRRRESVRVSRLHPSFIHPPILLVLPRSKKKKGKSFPTSRKDSYLINSFHSQISKKRGLVSNEGRGPTRMRFLRESKGSTRRGEGNVRRRGKHKKERTVERQ